MFSAYFFLDDKMKACPSFYFHYFYYFKLL